ncbi:MAG: tetratricopeptide repeat protein, partial [Eubacteriales bacterium]
EEALSYLDRAWNVECRYNQNPEDGSVGYLRGICLENLGRYDEAYDAFFRAAWSNNVISPAMTGIAAIDGRRGDYRAMYTHAMAAAEKERRHPLAVPYAALALYRQGQVRYASDMCREALAQDPLNQLARYALVCITGKGKRAFLASLHSDPAQTALDIGFDLLRAGFAAECRSLIEGVLSLKPDSAMLHYTLAYLCDRLGDTARAAKERRLAAKEKIVDVFPSRPGEIIVLRAALDADETDGFAAYLLGCIRYDAQQYEEAAALWEKAVRYLPDFYIPYRNLALACFNHLHRPANALPLMRRAVELHPGDATLLTETATVMQALGSSGDENAVFLDTYKPETVTDQMQLTIARAYNAAGLYDIAEQAMRSHTFSPGEGAEFATAEPYMYACFARGRKAMKEGRYADALRDFRASQKLPENLHVGFWNESVMMPYLYYEAAAHKALGETEQAQAIIGRLAQMKDTGMWNMGGEFVYYYAMAVRLGGEEMRAQKIMRDAILRWEEELAGGCTYHRAIGGLYNCFVGDGTQNRLAALYGMLGYGCMFNGDMIGAAEKFRESMRLAPSAKIAFELELLEDPSQEAHRNG